MIEANGGAYWPIEAHLVLSEGIPALDWAVVDEWAQAFLHDEADRLRFRRACEVGWLLHLRDALGPQYVLAIDNGVALLSSLEPTVAKATIAYVRKTQQRVLRVLGDLARAPENEHAILVVFDEEDVYYRYVATCYPDEGTFATSSGMFVDQGCAHFLTIKNDLQAIEPVIAHELTHARLSHLQLPLWLDEGMAVNTEDRLCPRAIGAFTQRSTPQQMKSRHRRFWQSEKIQAFWSGESFHEPGESQELSYDLARILVQQIGREWAAFQPFASAACRADAGAAAAQTHLGVGLGQIVCALLELEWSPVMEPLPKTLQSANLTRV